MSYNIYLYAPPCPTCGHEDDPNIGDYTSNMAGAWEAAGCLLLEWDGRLASEILPQLQQGIAAIEADPDAFKRFEPSNGWGSVSGMLDWLRRIEERCRRRPDGKLVVSS